MAEKKNTKRPTLRPVGRPPSLKGRLAQWIKDQGLSREGVAKKLEVSRRYVDALCREQRVPHAEVMDRIHRLTDGLITSAYWASVQRARKKAKS